MSYNSGDYFDSNSDFDGSGGKDIYGLIPCMFKPTHLNGTCTYESGSSSSNGLNEADESGASQDNNEQMRYILC